ncbi:hypothetical protein MC885_014729 [Smutsia gigantea]|nr:hypothetical protein MC885_014729 [Smutsia gigantea]
MGKASSRLGLYGDDALESLQQREERGTGALGRTLIISFLHPTVPELEQQQDGRQHLAEKEKCHTSATITNDPMNCHEIDAADVWAQRHFTEELPDGKPLPSVCPAAQPGLQDGQRQRLSLQGGCPGLWDQKKGSTTNPEAYMNISEIISYHGCPYENVQDSLWKKMFQNSSKPVVYLQHVLIASANKWICNMPNNSQDFLRADSGYDVWMGNS